MTKEKGSSSEDQEISGKKSRIAEKRTSNQPPPRLRRAGIERPTSNVERKALKGRQAIGRGCLPCRRHQSIEMSEAEG
jgi:hypothetical protein